MTARGFCVVAALSSQTSRRPWTRSSRMGKSRLMLSGSKIPPAGVEGDPGSEGEAEADDAGDGCPASSRRPCRTIRSEIAMWSRSVADPWG